MDGEDFGAPKKNVQSALDLLNSEELQEQADKEQALEQENAEQLRASTDAFNEGTDPTKDSDAILKALMESGPQEGSPDSPLDNPDPEKLNVGEYGHPEFLPGQPPNPAITGGPAREGHPQKHIPLLPYAKVLAQDWDGNEGTYIVHGYLLSSSGGSSVSAKSAIVPYNDAYISWYCSEEPECRFLDTLLVPIRWAGRGAARIPDRFRQCVDPKSIRVIGAVARNIPSAISAEVKGDKVHVKVKTPLFYPNPTTIRVRIQGIRKDVDAPRWAEKSKEDADRNNDFWAQAHEVTGR